MSCAATAFNSRHSCTSGLALVLAYFVYNDFRLVLCVPVAGDREEYRRNLFPFLNLATEVATEAHSEHTRAVCAYVCTHGVVLMVCRLFQSPGVLGSVAVASLAMQTASETRTSWGFRLPGAELGIWQPSPQTLMAFAHPSPWSW